MVRPSDVVIAWASAIMDLHGARRPGSEVTRSRVARVRTLIGLKQTLPQSLSQMFQRIVSRIGASNPADTRASRRASERARADVGLLRLQRADHDVLRTKRRGVIACRQIYRARLSLHD